MMHMGNPFFWAPPLTNNPTEIPVETVVWKDVTKNSCPRVLDRLQMHPEEAPRMFNHDGVIRIPLSKACKVQPPDSVSRCSSQRTRKQLPPMDWNSSSPCILI